MITVKDTQKFDHRISSRSMSMGDVGVIVERQKDAVTRYKGVLVLRVSDQPNNVHLCVINAGPDANPGDMFSDNYVVELVDLDCEIKRRA